MFKSMRVWIVYAQDIIIVGEKKITEEKISKMSITFLLISRKETIYNLFFIRILNL